MSRNTSCQSSLDYTTGSKNTSRSSPSISTPSGKPRSTDMKQVKGVSLSLDETGDSTKSLLSVLSHSSIEDLSASPGSDKSSRSPKKDDSRSNSPTSPLSETFSKSTPAEPTLTHWEKWLIKKTEEEREKVQEEVKRKMEEMKQKEVEENRKKERRKVIERRVKEWMQDKDKSEEKKKKIKEIRMKLSEQRKLEEEARKVEKARASREAWLEKKRQEEEEKKHKAQEERIRKAQEEMERKERAEEAYRQWKKDAKNRPRPLTGSFYGKGHVGDSSYPVPGYCNPIPWMPIPTPAAEKKQKSKNSKTKVRGHTPGNKQVLSPPLLYRDRSSGSIRNIWGRPR